MPVTARDRLAARAAAASVTLVTLGLPGLAVAHTGEPGTAAWTLRAPLAIVALAVAWLYGRAAWRLGARWPISRTLAAAAGALAAAAALLPPLDTLAGTSLTAHMAQHTLLIVVAAPLLAVGRPLTVIAAARARPLPFQRMLFAPRPGLACAVHATALWLWHLPPLYDVALERAWIHAVAHTTLFGSAAWLWWSVVRGRTRVVGALWLFVTAFHAGGLGALLALAPRPWFRGATLEDQQLAGLLMWVPAGVVLTAIALAVLGGWLRAGARRPVALGLVATALLAALGAGGCNRAAATAAGMTGGNPAHGRQAMRTYGCPTCHSIPGVEGAVGSVGPPLEQLARRSYVAGAPNAPDHLVRWLQHPRLIRPGTPMPEMGVSERDARDIAAYLYTLR
jgi:cytochrome c oxidase assembly factor CtaG